MGETLEKHMRIVHDKTLKENKCNRCPIVIPFDSKEELELHIIKNHPPEKEDAVKVLGDKLLDEAKLLMEKYGMGLMHPKLQLYQCEKCNAILCNEMDLEEHYLEQHNAVNTSSIFMNVM